MKKFRTLTAIALVMILTVSAAFLSACGSKDSGDAGKEESAKEESAKEESAKEESAEQESSGEESTLEQSSRKEESAEDAEDTATVRHEVGSAVFYTEEKTEKWIKDNVFDFAGFTAHYGLGRPTDDAGLRAGTSDFYVELIPAGEGQINAFGICRGGVCNVEVIDMNPSGKTVRIGSGYEMPYELAEIGQFMVEFAANQRVDYEKPVALDWLYDIGLSEEDFSIMFWQ